MKHDLGEKVCELQKVVEVMLDREMEDEREEDPDGVDLSIDEYHGGGRAVDAQVNKGFQRFEMSNEEFRLIKALNVCPGFCNNIHIEGEEVS